MKHSNRAVLVSGLVACVGAAWSPALAQQIKPSPMPARGARMVPALPDVQAPAALTIERLHRYAKVLDLDTDQTTAAESLYEGYTKSVQRTQKQMREDMRRAEEDLQDGDRGAFERMVSSGMAENSRKMGELRDQFLSDLKALLRPEQAGNWDKLERLRRRDNSLARGSLSGSTVDLLNIVDGLGLSPAERAPMSETLGQYELDLDRLLKDREAGVGLPPADEGGSRSFDGDSIKKFLAQQREGEAKVQEVNERYARLLADMIPTEKRAAFDELVKQQTFRKVYREASIAKRAKAAESLADLSPAQRASLRKALDEYNRNLRAANDRWADAINKAEKAGQPTGAGFGMLGGKPSPELAEARKDRRDLDNMLRDTINNTLSPDQIALLPTNDGSGVHNVVIDTGGPGGHGVFIASDDVDEDDGPMLGGMGGGGGVMVIQHTVTSDGEGPEQHEVIVTTPATPATPDKPKKN